MSYTIRLLRLECLQAQESSGDEIYFTLNDAVIWRAEPDKLHHVPDAQHCTSAIDFMGGRKLMSDGWQLLTPFDPKPFVIKGRTGRSLLQIWDADTFTPDDLLGTTPIDETQSTGGQISVIFRRDGAHYRLTYQVEKE